VHPRDHQTVVQEAQLHVLTTNSRTAIVLLAVAPNLVEHLRVDLKPAQAPVRDILIATREAYNLRCRTEPVPQNSVEDVEVAVCSPSGAPGLGPAEF
jgi:hypothetical protein